MLLPCSRVYIHVNSVSRWYWFVRAACGLKRKRPSPKQGFLEAEVAILLHSLLTNSRSNGRVICSSVAMFDGTERSRSKRGEVLHPSNRSRRASLEGEEC